MSFLFLLLLLGILVLGVGLGYLAYAAMRKRQPKR